MNVLVKANTNAEDLPIVELSFGRAFGLLILEVRVQHVPYHAQEK